MLSVQLHLSRAVLTEANWPPFPQHDLVLNLRAHPEGVGASPADSASAFFFLFEIRFLLKWLIKTTRLTSEQEERPTAAVATRGGGREMLPTEYLGVLGRCRAVGCTHLAETRQGGHTACLTPPSTPAWLASCAASFPPRHPGAGGR